VSFGIRHGEIFRLLGLNGAGKATLNSTLAAEQRPSIGDAVLLGLSVREIEPCPKPSESNSGSRQWSAARRSATAITARTVTQTARRRT